MRRLSLLLLIGLGSFAIAGCGFIDGFLSGSDDASVPEDEVALDGVPLPSNEEPAQPEDFVEPIVPAAPGAAAIAAAELIQSTNPDERAIAVSTSRSDPFATVVPATPIVLERPEPPPGTTVTPTGTTGPTPVATSGSGRPPGSISPIQPLPVLPRPELAESVGVSGVIQIGNTPHAIVQAPGEPTSRYVTAGQRLSNGQILVKRIEIREGLEPRVILEENGIEVAVTVGTGGTATASAGAANTAVPASQATTGSLPTLPPALALPPAPQLLQSQG